MFDVNTLQAYRSFFAEEVMVEKDGRRLVWQGRPLPKASRARSPRRASRWSCSTARARASSPARCTASATSPKRRCWPRSSGAGLECLDIFGHGYDGILEQPLDEAEHTKAIYISRATRSR